MALGEKIYFEEDTEPIITNILKKYSIEDSYEKVIDKLSTKKMLQGTVIIDSAEKIFIENAKDAEVLSLLKNGLEITDQLASQIFADIKEKLIPIAKKYTLGEVQAENLETPKKIENTNSTFVAPKNIGQTKPKASRVVKKPEAPKSPTGPDKYREPIE